MFVTKELSILILILGLNLALSAPNVAVETESEHREKRSRRYRDHDLEEEIEHLRDDLRALKSKVRDADGGVHIHMHDGGEVDHHDDRHDDRHDDHHHHGDQNIHLYMHIGGEEESNAHVFAHCEMVDIDPESHHEEHVHGEISLEQRGSHGAVHVNVDLRGFEHHAGDHAFEVHTEGDISDHCRHLGAEFDDSSVDHSHDHSKTGDFGDLHSNKNGIVRQSFDNNRTTLIGKHSIIGRTLAVHHSAHDHSGADIIGCCVIGRTSHATFRRVHHYAHCEMQDIDPAHGTEHVQGTIDFDQTDNGPVYVSVKLSGFEHHAGDHAFEIHNNGDLSDHCGNLGQASEHGDLGDFHTDEHGVGSSSFRTTAFSLTGRNSVIGQSVAIHHSAHGQAGSTDIIGCCVIGSDDDDHAEDDSDETHYGHCEMIDIDPEHGLNHVHGDVNFVQVGNDPTRVYVDLEGFEHHAGDHRFEVHVNGDISDHCRHVGAEYDDPSEDHSRYHSPTGHFDNIHSDEHGIARQNFTDGRIGLHGSHNIIGKSLAVHASAAGSNDSDIIGCCVVGKANAPHHHRPDHEEFVEAVCHMVEGHGENDEHVHGDVTLRQSTRGGPVNVQVELEGFQAHAGDHAFEVHTHGDTSEHCDNIGEAFDDTDEDHSHFITRTGDMGQVHSDDSGRVHQNLTSNRISLVGRHSVLGMSMAIHHFDHDHATSKDVIGCCVIGKRSSGHH